MVGRPPAGASECAVAARRQRSAISPGDLRPALPVSGGKTDSLRNSRRMIRIGMRQIALALLFVTLGCKEGSESPEPGSRLVYESCKSGLPPEEELCGEGLVCQGSLDPGASYCAPACSEASEDIWSQDPECPEIDGFVSYCAAAGGLSCVIRCESSCPDGLGLQCPDHSSRCQGQEGP